MVIYTRLLRPFGGMAQKKSGRRMLTGLTRIAGNTATASRVFPLLALAMSAPAIAGETGVYTCDNKAASTSDLTDESITTEKQPWPLRIEIAEVNKNNNKICTSDIRGYISSYCTSHYKATVRGLGQPMIFYGDDATNFRGLMPTDYLVVFDSGFLMSFKLGSAVFVHIGDCKRL